MPGQHSQTEEAVKSTLPGHWQTKKLENGKGIWAETILSALV